MKAVKDYKELSYLLKAGHTPAPVREKHTGNWNLTYSDQILSHNVPYPVAVQHQKTYQMFGNVYPNKDLFKIKPCK